MVAALIGEIAGDPMALCECFVNTGERRREFTEVMDLEPGDGVLEKKRAIVLTAAHCAALEEDGAFLGGDEAASGDDRLRRGVHGITTRDNSNRKRPKPIPEREAGAPAQSAATSS